ncbi:hypothetical protein [Alistipes putredinis]|jgi:uncharacterized membrane protein|uniref:hypothetical protein n=1 Tax=Alistipes putredinis TaxID=28117 RepID=UPI0024AE787E|nr:hypothetical protein [Alistipes putredinis]
MGNKVFLIVFFVVLVVANIVTIETTHGPFEMGQLAWGSLYGCFFGFILGYVAKMACSNSKKE